MAEERLKLAVFVDFDNIQIGVKDTMGKDFDVSVVLEALKERGEVITKVAYSDWSRANEFSRQMTQHAVQMVQRNVTPRGDKNGADINLALDALEMAFTRHHINAFAIVGGDSDFIALVEKLKQYDKRVFVVGGRGFTSNILQRNCTEFIAYENLLRTSGGGDGGARPRPRRGEAGRASLEVRPLSDALPNVQRALAVLAEREVSPQLGLLKSTLLQLDSTFSERDYGAGSFLEFMQKMEQASLLHLRKLERGYRVEIADAAPAGAGLEAVPGAEGAAFSTEPVATLESAPSETAQDGELSLGMDQALAILRQALEFEAGKSPNRPLYLRHIRHGLKAVDKDFDERRAGFQGLTDFLYRAQREGWLSLQRDRNGVLRMFYRPQDAVVAETGVTAASAPVQVPGNGIEVAPISAEAEAEAVTDIWTSGETVVLGEDVTPRVAPGDQTSGDQPMGAVLEKAPVEVTGAEEPSPDAASPAAARKGRTRSTGRPRTRRTPSRRKTTKDSQE